MIFFSYPSFIGWLSGLLQRNSSNTTGRRKLFSVVICGLYSPCIHTYMCLVVLCNYEVYVLKPLFPAFYNIHIPHNVSHILCLAPFCFKAEVLSQNSHFTQAYTHTHTQQVSQLALEQVPNHLLARNVRRLPQRREVKRAAQTIRKAKEEHGRDPAAGVLEREAALGHLVLLGVAAAQVVHASRGIHLGFVLAGDVGDLRAGQDVEVVVGRVAAGVALCANGRA